MDNLVWLSIYLNNKVWTATAKLCWPVNCVNGVCCRIASIAFYLKKTCVFNARQQGTYLKVSQCLLLLPSAFCLLQEQLTVCVKY